VWEKKYPQMKMTYDGAAGQVGSSEAWSGEGDAGEGKMTLTSTTPEQIKIKLEFIKPFAANNEIVFDLKPAASGTEVSWTMNGEKGGFMGKAMGMFMDFDKMVGGDFETGLANLKTVAEGDAKHAGDTAAAVPAP